jgi:hypothetical protein
MQDPRSSPNGSCELALTTPDARKAEFLILALNTFFERFWPINKLSTDIFVVGKKVEAFNG